MYDRNIIAVVGATGAQGGGLARAILAHPQYRFAVRALTRYPDSTKARALAALGAEVVAADLDEPESIEQAFSGAYGAFCVTNFWEHFSPEREQVQARTMALAAKSAGLRHVVWSTLEDVRRWVPLKDASLPTLHGKYKVPDFDGKGAVDHVFTDLAVPTTFMRASFYWDNLIQIGMGPRRDEQGRLVFTLPMGDSKLPGIASADVGKCAYGIFKGGKRFIGQTVGVAGEHLSGQEMAQALGQALGSEVSHDAMSPEAYRALEFPGAPELGNMFQFNRDFNEMFCRSRSVETARQLNPDLLRFRDWLATNKGRISIA